MLSCGTPVLQHIESTFLSHSTACKYLKDMNTVKFLTFFKTLYSLFFIQNTIELMQKSKNTIKKLEIRKTQKIG